MEIFLNAWIEREDGDFFGNSQSSRSIDRFLRKSTYCMRNIPMFTRHRSRVKACRRDRSAWKRRKTRVDEEMASSFSPPYFIHTALRVYRRPCKECFIVRSIFIPCLETRATLFPPLFLNCY